MVTSRTWVHWTLTSDYRPLTTDDRRRTTDDGPLTKDNTARYLKSLTCNRRNLTVPSHFYFPKLIKVSSVVHRPWSIVRVPSSVVRGLPLLPTFVNEHYSLFRFRQYKIEGSYF